MKSDFGKIIIMIVDDSWRCPTPQNSTLVVTKIQREILGKILQLFYLDVESYLMIKQIFGRKGRKYLFFIQIVGKKSV